MRSSAIILCLINLAVLACLPSFFFRKGRLTAGWALTAAPFIIAGAGLFLAPPLRTGAWFGTALVAAATLLAAASAYLVGYTIGTHKHPVSLWHQEEDTPQHLVTYGAYARVRHPFYAAFQLNLVACAAVAPGVLTALALAFGMLQLNRTAAREESRILQSAAGDEYRAYMQRAGRFLPRLTQSLIHS